MKRHALDLQLLAALLELSGTVTGPDAGEMPVLISATHDPDKGVQFDAIQSLGRFGPDAKIVVPALSRIAQFDSASRLPVYTSHSPYGHCPE